MSKTLTVAFSEGEKTRLLGTPSGDLHLCKRHAEGRLAKGQSLGVPASGANILFGLKPFPTGQEPCDDCLAELRMNA